MAIAAEDGRFSFSITNTRTGAVMATADVDRPADKMNSTPANDLQSQFESRASRADFLSADKIEDAIGLCMSGGGYRAMLYHIGALVRLNELGFLPQLQEIASVSGGSIAAGVLARAWSNLRFDDEGVATNFIGEVAEPIIRFASIGVDVKAILLGLLPCRTAAAGVARAYDRHLRIFKRAAVGGSQRATPPIIGSDASIIHVSL